MVNSNALFNLLMSPMQVGKKDVQKQNRQRANGLWHDRYRPGGGAARIPEN